MPKRRRERDRPKFGPDATYDPNKRVLLSYASDDDEVKDAADLTTNPVAEERPVTSYQMEEEDGQAKSGAAQSDELENAAGGEDEVDQTPPEQEVQHNQHSYRHQSRNSQKWGGNVRKNDITNQFPSVGLVSYQWEEEDDDEDYDSTTEEAMAYLRSVRSERQGIPEVLTASQQALHGGSAKAEEQPANEDAEDDAYEPTEEGVWVAPPSPAVPVDDESSPQRTYTRIITDRFLDQRKQLHLPPSAEALAELGDSHPITFPKGNNKAYAEWHRLLSSKAPRIAQIRSLDQQTVFDLLEVLQTRVLVGGKNISKATGNWIWSLLARLDEVGNMTNDEVYPLRELGKRAVFLQYSLTSPEVAAQLEAVGQAGTSSQFNEDEIPLDDLEDADAKSEQAKTSSEQQQAKSADENTLATLDMILVIVGEVYGQRDLLEFRQPWSVAQQTPG